MRRICKFRNGHTAFRDGAQIVLSDDSGETVTVDPTRTITFGAYSFLVPVRDGARDVCTAAPANEAAWIAAALGMNIDLGGAVIAGGDIALTDPDPNLALAW